MVCNCSQVETPAASSSARRHSELAATAVFFAAFYIYLWLFVDLRLIYHGLSTVDTDFPAFYKGWAFFRESVAHPGGLAEYLGAFLSQFFYVGWAGALVITLLGWLLCIFTQSIIKAACGCRVWPAGFVGPILLLAIYTRYTHHLVVTTALAVSLGFVYLYLKIAPNVPAWRIPVFASLLVIDYTVAAAAYPVFAACCVIYELLSARRWVMGILFLLLAAALPYLAAAVIFNVSLQEAFSDLLPQWRTQLFKTDRRMITVVYALYASLPMTLLAISLRRFIVRDPSPPAARADGVPPDSRSSTGARAKNMPESPILPAQPPPGARRLPVLRWCADVLIVFAAAGLTVFFSHDGQTRTLYTAEFFAAREMWPEVLRVAREHPSKNYFLTHAVNRALYHTGRLAYDMFLYPQHHDALFLTAPAHAAADWKKFDIYLEMGHINMTEHGAAEAVEMFGERPELLKQIAFVNLVKGKLHVARVYLNALSRTLFYDDWARSYLAALQSDPSLSCDAEVQRLRRSVVAGDDDLCFGTSAPPEKCLLTLLNKDRHNRMAFEYLMAWYLLTGQLDKFSQNLVRLSDFDYPGIPRAYEEAILMYQLLLGKTAELRGREISEKSRRRFNEFSTVYLGKYGRNKQAAFGELAAKFGDTYFFYYLYGPQD